jgi:serine/threonine-protein kinase HipA
MDILLGSQESVQDREVFFTAQILFWLLAAPDGHAKNYSVFIVRFSRFKLIPLYDIISSYPVLGRISSEIPKVITELSASLPSGFPDAIAGPIFKGLEDQCRILFDS